ncbi:RCC1 BLIP-II [Pyrrhoderma noxium]|uniref:RCC1 BLIP-II n=1 Tax=Pyrrhoderma noxium TaxID=2282107 RepID=A0A286ULL7_9AGAM|nr:RCC1 BLIP-II [Pyrrhoderma noxium]
MAGTLTRKSSRTKVDPAANGEADAKTASAKTDTTKKDTAKKDTAKKDAVKKDTVKKATAKTTAAPAPKKATKAKAPTTTAKTAAPKTRTKRPMTPEIEDSAEGDDSDKQPTKRARSIRTQGSVTTTASSDDEAISEKKEKRKSAATNASSSKKTINSLPTPPEHPRPSNQIFVWGAGNFGQFGMGPEYLDEFDKPKKNPWFEKKIEEGIFGGEGAGIESIAAGGLHSLFVDEKGTIWSCGVNDDAALGRETKDVPDPEKEGAVMNIDILTSYPYPLQTLVDENFRAVSIAAGDSICAAVSAEGELRVWGSFRANEGSLGFSNGSKYQFTPAPILDLPKDEKVSSVAAGNNHLVVLTTHGNIYTWGAGEQGQLGRKIIERRKIHGTTPEKVTLKSRSLKAVVVGAGNYTSFAVDEKGGVWGWGLNNMAQVGTGYEVLGEGVRVKSISGGEHHTLFLTSDGRVFAVGRANGGQLGIPEDNEKLKSEDFKGFIAEPVHIPFPDPASEDPVVHISAGIHSNFAVTAAGALYAWGESNQGELGLGDETEAKTPQVLVRKVGGSWQAIAASCGGQHSIGLFKKKA